MLLFAFIVLALITSAEVISVLTPFVVFASTEIVKLILPKLQGWIIVLLIVPLLSLLVTWMSSLVIDPGLSFWAQTGYGLLAVFMNELFKQLKSIKKEN